MKRSRLIVVAMLALLLVPSLASAHQPRLTESRLTEITDPEVSKAYYGTLTGQPDVYVIRATAPFNLYVNVLVPFRGYKRPDLSGWTAISVVILRDGVAFANLDGANYEWKKFYEPFGADTYWMGPEYKARAEAGTYEIRVSSPNNDSKYSLAVGEIEAFDQKEGLNALNLIPELKKDFFEESPITFIKSPFGWGLILIMYALAFIVGFVYRFIVRKFATSTNRVVSKNINKSGRLIRLALGLALLFWAITTTWSPILLFLSGFCIFASIFSLQPSGSEEVLRPDGRM